MSSLSRLNLRSVNPIHDDHEPLASPSSDVENIEEGIRIAVEKSTSSIQDRIVQLEDRIVQALSKHIPDRSSADEECKILDALRTKPKSVNVSSCASVKPKRNVANFHINVANSETLPDGSDNEADCLVEPANTENDEFEERIAPQVLSQVSPYGSFKNWVRMVDWKKERNKHEAESLASAIDCFLNENVDLNSLGLEILLRRLNGVHLADTTNNWSVCSALQWSGPNNTLLPRTALTSAYRQAAQMERLTKSITKLAHQPANKFYQNGGRQHYQKFDKFANQKKQPHNKFAGKNSTTGGHAGGASQ